MSSKSPLPDDHAIRIERMLLSLEGLSVGDAFGQKFFIPGQREWSLRNKQAPPGPWPYTDDTEMALSVCEVLIEHGSIDQDLLALKFAERFVRDPYRGYGAGAQQILREIHHTGKWREPAMAAFRGAGSLGNGAAMRVAPLGAYFCDDMDRVVREAQASAEVTHAHAEGIAGAITIAVAAAWATNRLQHRAGPSSEMLSVVLEYVPPGPTHENLQRALSTPLDEWEYTAANILGSGGLLTAADTVPFCLWCAAAHIDSYADALWAAMHVGGDIDTNCAIIGGIVAARVGRSGLPVEWQRAREPLGWDRRRQD